MEDQKGWKNWKCRIENEGPNVGWKMQDLKMEDHIAGVENAGPKHQDRKM